MICSNSFCKKDFDENTAPLRYFAYDLQKKDKKIEFCSYTCMKIWLGRKMATMILTIAIGVVLAFSVDFPTGFALLFIPYMIRQCLSMLKGLFKGGSFGEFIGFFVVIIGSVTVVFPLYKLIKEIIFFVNTFKNLKQVRR